MTRLTAAVHAGCAAITLLGLASPADPVCAQSYPARPIRYLVGFTPGTATDIVARLVSQKLTERWGQQVIVDNRVGAAGTISVATAARADPDGHTLYMASSTMVVSMKAEREQVLKVVRRIEAREGKR